MVRSELVIDYFLGPEGLRIEHQQLQLDAERVSRGGGA